VGFAAGEASAAAFLPLHFFFPVLVLLFAAFLALGQGLHRGRCCAGGGQE